MIMIKKTGAKLPSRGGHIHSCARPTEPGLWLFEIQTWKDLCAFLLHRVETGRIESQRLQNCRSDLHGFDKSRQRSWCEARFGNEQHHVGVVVRKSAVLHLF